MKTNILRLISGAKQAVGLTVIIDVFRAFSTTCCLLNSGVKKIFITSSIEDARFLKKENTEYLLLGEREGKPILGFDYGNSPSEIEFKNFTDRIAVLNTSSGTQGVINAKNAMEVLVCSFLNFSTTAEYIKKKDPDELSIVAMGNSGITNAYEDELCAQALKDEIENGVTNFNEIKNLILNNETSKKFHDPRKSWFSKNDLQLCLSKDKYPYLQRIRRDNNHLFVLNENNKL